MSFIGIGAPRSGSTWVSENLKAHPEICFSSIKETKFFADIYKFQKGGAQYTTYFSHCVPKKAMGEFDPGYLNVSEAASRIHSIYPDIKLIVILRNPIYRAYSHYNIHKIKSKTWDRSFREAIEREGNTYVASGFYAKKILEYLKYFKKEQFLFIPYENIAHSPEEVIRKIYQFVGVDDSYRPASLLHRINYGGISRARIPTLNTIIYKVENAINIYPLFRKLISPLKLLKIHKFVSQIKKKNIMTNLPEPKETTEEIVAKDDYEYLESIYRSDVIKLSEITNFDFLSYWKFKKD